MATNACPLHILSLIGFLNNTTCVYYHTTTETIHHLLLECPTFTHIWFDFHMLPTIIELPTFESNPLECLKKLILHTGITNLLNIPKSILIPFYLCHIWLTHNATVFRSAHKPLSLSHIINLSAEFFYLAGMPAHSPSRTFLHLK